MPTTFEVLSPDGSPIFLACLPNERGGGKPWHQYVHDDTQLEQFIATYNKPRFALYHAAAILQNGAWRKKENVRATLYVWGDLDFKDHPDIPREEIARRLGTIPLRPTFFVNSGHGIHCYWLLKEEEDASPGAGQRRVEEVLQLICNYIGGDPQAAETARLLRLPGSHNTRNAGESLLVTLEDVDLSRRYDLSELTDFLLEAHPILPPRKKANDEPALDLTEAPSGPVDVEMRLASMRYRGKGWTSIHATQLSVTGALINRGEPVDEIVARVLAETGRVAERDTPKDEAQAKEQGKLAPSKWKWDEERDSIRKMCFDLVNKAMRTNGEDLGHTLPERLYDQWNKILAAGKLPVISNNGAGEHVRGYAKTEQKSKPSNGPEASSEPPKDDTPKAPFIIRPFEPFDVAELPQREFLFGRHYQRRTVSGTIAPGGTGKSSLQMVESISMATGRALLGEAPRERVRVWYHNGEDNFTELRRRVAAICQRYKVPMTELQDWFFMTSGNEVPLRIAEGYNQVRLQFDQQLIKYITEYIGDNKIGSANLDPLVTLHGVPENNPGQMDQVIRIFTRLTDTQNCSVDLSHHTRKLPPGSGDTDVVLDDLRGAGAIKDAMRAVRMLNFMSEKDAEAAGLLDLERTTYFRVDRAKANYSAPAKEATWHRFVNETLPNGDDVGVVVPWQFPGQDAPPSPEKLEAERKAEHVFLEVLRRLALAGRFVHERGPHSAPAEFAREREAKMAKVGKAALNDAMRRLFDRGKIRLDEYTTSHRNKGYKIVET